MNDKLRKLQLCELDILKEFVRICEKFSLKYYLSGGTLLGAVRHQGFIPWDDDIDVAMPRKDYDLFAKLCQSELEDNYFYQSPETDPYYFLSYAKIRKNGTEVCEERFYLSKFHKGVFVDIFPLDFCPKPGIMCHFIFNILAVMNYRGQIDSGEVYKPYKEISGKIGYGILRLFSPQNLLVLRKNILWISEILSEKKYFACYPGAYGYHKEIFECIQFDKGEKVVFEGLILTAPKLMHQVIRQLYGPNYREFPPENQRNFHVQISSINLGNSS